MHLSKDYCTCDYMRICNCFKVIVVFALELGENLCFIINRHTLPEEALNFQVIFIVFEEISE
jgi:hypothetical protein